MSELSARRRNLVLAAMCLALVLVISGVSMLTNTLPSMAEDLNLSQTEQTWVVDAYALPFAALLLIAGAIGDRFGRRGALAGGTAIFTPERVKPGETTCYADLMSASGVGSLIQATVGRLGGSGRR